MKNFLVSSLVAAAAVATLAPLTLGLPAIANAAPTGASSVDSTIDNLRMQGFEVIVNRTGNDASEQCSITAVRPGQTFSRTDSGAPGAGADLVTTVISKTVYVDLTC
jgi:hypothetical protein